MNDPWPGRDVPLPDDPAPAECDCDPDDERIIGEIYGDRA